MGAYACQLTACRLSRTGTVIIRSRDGTGRVADLLAAGSLPFTQVGSSRAELTPGQGDTPDLGGRRRAENPRLGGYGVPIWGPEAA